MNEGEAIEKAPLAIGCGSVALALLKNVGVLSANATLAVTAPPPPVVDIVGVPKNVAGSFWLAYSVKRVRMVAVPDRQSIRTEACFVECGETYRPNLR